MGLQKTAVGLGIDLGQFDLQRRQAEIQPGRHIGNGQAADLAFEYELGDDLLHPGGPRFGPSGDDDIVVAVFEFVPIGGIHAEIPHFPGFHRPIGALVHGFAPSIIAAVRFYPTGTI